MTKLFRQIGDEKVEYTEDEYAQYEADKVAQAIAKTEAEAKEAQRQAILDRLGLTADEAKLILG